MDTPPAPGTRYSVWPSSPPRFEVVRVVQEHPENWVLELRGIFAPRWRVRVVTPREAAAEAARVRRAGEHIVSVAVRGGPAGPRGPRCAR